MLVHDFLDTKVLFNFFGFDVPLFIYHFLMQGTEIQSRKFFLCTYLQIIERYILYIYSKLCQINGKEGKQEAAKYLIPISVGTNSKTRPGVQQCQAQGQVFCP